MMKPALETLSLGKGGVTRPKQQHSGGAPALAVVPRSPPSQPPSPHEQEQFSSSPETTGSIGITTPSPTRPGHPIFQLAPHQQLLHLLYPQCTIPHHTAACPGMGSLRAGTTALLSHGKQAPSHQQVPMKPFCHLCAALKHQHGVTLEPAQGPGWGLCPETHHQAAQQLS